MIGSYDHLVVALSALIAVAGSYSALDLAGRVTAAKGWARGSWLTGGAAAMGIGIWSMHFTGMLAFRLPVPVSYHWPTVLASLVVAILSSAVALYVVSRRKMGWIPALAAGVIMGSGIAALHYLDMFAMRMAAMSRFSPFLVILSVAFAMAFSLAALRLAFSFREDPKGIDWQKIGGAMVMGAAICAMHYTGMAAASFEPSDAPVDLTRIVSVSSLGTASIITVTLLVLGFAMLSASVDRRFYAQRLELTQVQARSELARLARIATLGELTASIAHEINQPLGAVVTYASATQRWLAAQPPDLDEARAAATKTATEAKRASEVITRIRALLQKESPQMERLDINEVIREVLDLTGGEILRGGITVKTELARDVPAVLGNRVQLQQVMLNLIMNGVEAMSTVTDRTRKVHIRSAKDPEGVLIVVEDNGAGLDPEDIGHIFLPFVTTKPQGIGMGLTISHSIIEAHGGRLWAMPGSPHGAVFQFILPITNGAT